MKQVIKIIGHHFKLILEVDAIVIDYRYIFHGFRPHSQTNGNSIFFEDRKNLLVVSRPSQSCALWGKCKKCNPQSFYCDTRNFYSLELFSDSHDRVRKFG